MSPYRQGFEVGYQDAKDGEHDAADEAAALAQAEAHSEPLLTSAQESDYWLGYYHGRAYARTIAELAEALQVRPGTVRSYLSTMSAQGVEIYTDGAYGSTRYRVEADPS